EHDNGWREPDEAPTVDLESGRVFDFIGAPAEIRQGVWPRGVARLADRPWSAALVAQHALTIYDRYRGDAAWTAFFAAMEARRDSLVATTGLSLDTLMHDYAYVRIGDLISLIFCNEWDEPHEYPPWTFTRDGDTVVVRPDPFEGRRVPLAIQAREVPN